MTVRQAPAAKRTKNGICFDGFGTFATLSDTFHADRRLDSNEEVKARAR